MKNKQQDKIEKLTNWLSKKTITEYYYGEPVKNPIALLLIGLAVIILIKELIL